MKEGIIRVLRIYSSADEATVASATGIPLAKYRRIENGEDTPTEAELEKIAAVFGVSTQFLNSDNPEPDKFFFRQTIDENIFVTEDMREQMRLRMTELSALEKNLIMLIRRTDNSEETLRRMIDGILAEL